MPSHQKRGGRLLVTGPLFGAPNADNDHLLRDCAVVDQINRYLSPIVTGRWGTGKSAILITRAKHVEEILTRIDPEISRDWYIREQDLDTQAIFALQRNFSESQSSFINTLQDIWRSEILRRSAIILAHLGFFYGDREFTKADHWKHIASFKKRFGYIDSLWKNIDNVLAILFPSGERRNSVSEFGSFFRELGEKTLRSNIFRCISDLERRSLVVPVIGIEPLETPASDLDSKVSVAQSVVSALLNCFRNDFIRSERQLLKVNISVPWNRIAIEDASLPSHLVPYIDDIRWSKSNLRVFINKRIEREALHRGVKLHTRPNHDAWDCIFVPIVENESYPGNRDNKEDSFDYVLRHTLWRARDIQTIARDCVDRYCRENSISNHTEFFRKRLVVDADCIRSSVASCTPANAKLRIEEARRKFRHSTDLFNILYGMKVPFGIEDLKSRFPEASDFKEWNEIIQTLWESGILGYRVDFKSDDGLKYFKKKYGDDSYRISKISGKIGKGFLFQYNVFDNNNVLGMIDRMSKEKRDFSVDPIIHPTFNEYLDLRLDNSGPLGC